MYQLANEYESLHFNVGYTLQLDDDGTIVARSKKSDDGNIYDKLDEELGDVGDGCIDIRSYYTSCKPSELSTFWNKSRPITIYPNIDFRIRCQEQVVKFPILYTDKNLDGNLPEWLSQLRNTIKTLGVYNDEGKLVGKLDKGRIIHNAPDNKSLVAYIIGNKLRIVFSDNISHTNIAIDLVNKIDIDIFILYIEDIASYYSKVKDSPDRNRKGNFIEQLNERVIVAETLIDYDDVAAEVIDVDDIDNLRLDYDIGDTIEIGGSNCVVSYIGITSMPNANDVPNIDDSIRDVIANYILNKRKQLWLIDNDPYNVSPLDISPESNHVAILDAHEQTGVTDELDECDVDIYEDDYEESFAIHDNLLGDVNNDIQIDESNIQHMVGNEPIYYVYYVCRLVN